MTLKQPENDPTFDVLAYMRSLSPIPDGKYECATVADWTVCWLLHYCSGITESTKMEYEKVVQQHINRVLGKVLLTELSHEDVQLFINSLNMGIGIDNKLSPKSIKNIHGTDNTRRIYETHNSRKALGSQCDCARCRRKCKEKRLL